MQSILSKARAALTEPRRRTSRSGLTFAALAALAGGTLFGACEMRIRDAVVGGTKNFLFTDLLPGALGELLPDLGATSDP